MRMLKWAGQNLRWGLLWGLFLAAGFGLLALIPALIRALIAPVGGWQKGLVFLQIMGVYLFGGIVGGALVGLLRPLGRWWLGRRVIGIIVGFPAMFAVRTAVYGTGGWTQEDLEGWIFTAVVWGFAMSWGPEPWAKEWAVEQQRRRRDLPRVE